jgi:hypothetical protein
MTRLARIRSLTFVLALSMLLVIPVRAEEAIAVPLRPTGDALVEGMVLIHTQDELATVTIEMSGLEPGAGFLARLHGGSCEAASAGFGHLGTVTADSEGRATLSASDLQMSASGAPIALTLALVADGDHVVTVVRDHQIACASIPRLPEAGLPDQP